MPDQATLSVLHASARERTVMRSLLNLAGSRDNKGGGWVVSEQPGGDLIIVDVDTPEGEQLWVTLGEQGRRPVAMTRRRDFGSELVLHKPLRSREFLDLLELIGRGSGKSQADPSQAAVEWQSWAASEDADSATLAEHLRRQTWTGPVILRYPQWPELVIDPGSGSWFYDGSIRALRPKMFAQVLPSTAGRPVSSTDLVTLVEGLGRRPLSELKWYAGLAQSRGRLHPDLVGEVDFMLTQVPGEAMDNERFAQLARLLIRAPVSIDELYHQSGETAENVATFLNACYTTGRLLLNRSARAAGF
ncbi:MAG: hypothetical protein HND55_07145 [Pseudomonadota bacterium]|nr:MAG: hypothetical protein HND55_07145 [Pseudomonadota bacterium]